MKKIIAYIILTCFTYQFTQAQVNYKEEIEVSGMNNRYVAQNKSTQWTLGYRIQILSTTDRRKMNDVVKNFETKFPEYEAVWTYEAPNYKVRVGAFRTRIEAEKLKMILREVYFSAFPVKDNKIEPIEYL